MTPQASRARPAPPDAAIDAHIEKAPLDVADTTGDGRTSLVTRVGPPPERRAVPVVEALGGVAGQRVIWQSPKGWHFDVRATSEPFPGHDGRLLIQVTAELDWYRSELCGEPLIPVEVYAHTVFLERPRDDD